ncbi:MAG TPA: glycoside hydrolase family 15 protein, partial [Chthonomonadales bacterium]|nr:glycoside hydrolase family 15 protein [Chthonomonadales bacterium]
GRFARRLIPRHPSPTPHPSLLAKGEKGRRGEGEALNAQHLILNTQHSTPYTLDSTLDSSLYALFAFGAFSADDPRIQATMRSVITRLWVQTEVGGIARYEGDFYFRRSGDIARVPGNPWFICTLWAAQWYIAQARTRKDLTTALELLLWAARRALPTGILPEQLHPETGEPLSVAPLTWSHAEFVITTLDYLEQWSRLR